MKKTVIGIERLWKVLEWYIVLIFGIKMQLKYILYKYNKRFC